MQNLERSLKRFSKDFGETTGQAVVRWSVQACRELALETQAVPNNKGEKPRGKQEGAIFKDSLNVLLVVDTLQSSGRGYRATNLGKTYYVSADKTCRTPEEINNWIELNRTRRRGRTAMIPVFERKACDKKTHKAAMKIRYKNAGIAKGAWLGAGADIARAQTGMERMSIGKNFLSYAQKHSKWGSARPSLSGWKPFADITNRAAHSADKNVLTRGGKDRAVGYSLKKTIAWYRKAMKKVDQKSP